MDIIILKYLGVGFESVAIEVPNPPKYSVHIGKIGDRLLKFPDRDLHKVSDVSPLILLSRDQIGSQNFVLEDPKCTHERPKQFL